ncbi:MAG: radical SAM protein [Bacteroidales bacterium]|nr:radical SAM protein [Bacteroidales bacterium]
MNIIGQFFYCAWWWFRATFFSRRKPLQSVIFISDRCNLSCKHCSIYNHETPRDKSLDQIKEELEYCYSLGSRFVDFEGGEPYLWRDGQADVNDLCRLARHIGFYSCTITTNAQKPFDGTVADSIWVSMDGVGEAHERVRGKGTFARLEENVAKCGCKALCANMAVNVLNADSVAAAIEYVKASPYFKLISLNFHTPFPGTEALALPLEKRREIIDMILDYKKRGYPIMNSRSGLKKMRDNDFVMRCWMTNFVFQDGTRADQCIGEDLGICPQCGFCMAGEESAVMELRPDTILSGLKLRV